MYLQVVSAAPSPSTNELTFIDEGAVDIIDIVTKLNEQTYELSAVDNNELVFGVVDVVQNVLNYIKCFVDGISKAVKDTSLAPLWEATKKDIDAILSRLNACRNGENKFDEIK